MTVIDEDAKKFLDHFPLEGDLTLQVLKGHLLVEETLRELFIMQLPFPKSLKGSGGTSFNCHQIICLVEAMTIHSQKITWIWKAAKKLNGIRNDLAHQLTPKGLEGKVEDLIIFVNKSSPEIQEVANDAGLPKDEKLILVVTAMCSCLSSLKPVLASYLIEAHKIA